MTRIITKHLVGLLTDLALTAADPAEGGATAAVLLHGARGYLGDQPGAVDLLVGTSTDGSFVGHGHVECHGILSPMLWPLVDVRAVIAVLKPLAKEAEHAVEITRNGDQVQVAEDPDLFGEGLTLSFAGLDPAEWPIEGARGLLEDIRVAPGADAPVALPRTDFVANRLAPFLKIASRRGELLEVYRYHQRLPVHVQIGQSYRGVVRPVQWRDEDRDAGAAPSGSVYPLALDGVSA